MRFRIILLLFLAGCTSVYNPDSGANNAIWTSGENEPRQITTHDLLSIRDIGASYRRGSVSLSPDRSKVAFQVWQADTETNSYLLNWYVVSTRSGSMPVHIGDGGQAILFAQLTTGRASGAIDPGIAKWSPTGSSVAYRKKTETGIQVWLAQSDGLGERRLTSDAFDVIDFQWSDDGKTIFYTTPSVSATELDRLLEREGDSGYLFDKRFLPAASREPILRSAISATLFADSDRAATTVYSYTLSTGRELKISALPEGLADEEPVLDGIVKNSSKRDLRSIAQNDGSLAWAENEDPSKYVGPLPPLTVWRISDNGDEVRCNSEICTGYITDIWLDERNSNVYFRRREGANFNSVGLYAWDGSDQVNVLVKNDDWFSDCQLAINHLICLHEAWTQPTRLVSVDLDHGTVQPLADPNSGFRDIEFGNVEKLTWSSADGSEATGHIVYPINYAPGTKYPLIVVQYRSRGFLRGGTGDEHPIHVLAANGFAVLSFDRPNLWAASAVEADPLERERQHWGDDLWERQSALDAIHGMIDELDQKGIIDTSRIGITGLSDGKETAWYSLMYSDRFSVASVSGGGWSPLIYYLVPSDLRKNYYNFAAGLGAPGVGDYSRWQQISPEFHTDRIDVPILIQVSDSELLGAVAAHESLSDARKPVEMFVFPDEFHVKFEPVHRAAIYERNLDWFNFWLRDVEDLSPTKEKQYERWWELRADSVSD